MNTTIKHLLLVIAGMIYQVGLFAQSSPAPEKVDMNEVASFEMLITYNKTSHLIFPSAIRYVDLGSDYLIAGKAEDAENVLRVKAAVENFPGASNFTVITQDGRFYNFNVRYSDDPSTLSYDLQHLRPKKPEEKGNAILFEETGSQSPSEALQLMKGIAEKNKRIIRHIAGKGYGIKFTLKGIYIRKGKFFFHTELLNRSNVPFLPGYLTFKIIDRRTAKRTATQDKLLKPLLVLRVPAPVPSKGAFQNVYMLEQLTFSKDKLLLIEISEKNGGRRQTLFIENSDLIHARRIEKGDFIIH